jgi:hypothetical protein
MANKLVPKTRVKNGILYTNGMIRIDNVVLSYPHVLEPQEDDKGGKSYSAQGIANKETHKEIIDLCRETIKEIIAASKKKIAADKIFMKDGDKYFEGKDECAGAYVFTAREKKRPTLRDIDGTKLDPKDDEAKIMELFYGGAVASLLINPWIQDNSYGKRLNANLRTVKFVKDGTPFGEGRIDDDDAWDEEGGDGDWDDPGADDDNDI